MVSPSPVPCVGDCNGGDMYEWFDAFFAACDKLGGCRVDKIATHIYDCSADATMDKLEELHTRYNRPIWLTEFACPFTEDETTISSFMAAVLPRSVH